MLVGAMFYQHFRMNYFEENDHSHIKYLIAQKVALDFIKKLENTPQEVESCTISVY